MNTLENNITIYLSSIAIAEYSVKDDVTNLPLKTMKIIPFDFFDGRTSGEFHSILLERKEELKDIERNVIKDDCKLIAQVYNRKIHGYITKDKKSFGQIISPITKQKGFTIELIDLATPLSEYKGELFKSRLRHLFEFGYLFLIALKKSYYNVSVNFPRTIDPYPCFPLQTFVI